MNTPEFDPSDLTPGVPSAAILSSEHASLSEGAKQFIRQYVPADDGKDVIVTFETVSEFMPGKSRVATEAAGKTVEIFENRIYIRKNVRGNNSLEVHRPVREEDKREFPFSWQEYQKGNKAAERGTPLSKLAGMQPSILRHYHAFNVFTIEDMALVSDIGLQNLGTGSREFRRAALEWVEHAKPTSEADPKLLDLIARMDSKLDQQTATIEALREENAQLKARPPRQKPGRKPKIPLPPE